MVSVMKPKRVRIRNIYFTLIILLVIFIPLEYFGVLDPVHGPASACGLTSGLWCTGSKLYPDAIILTLQNRMGQDIVIKRLIINETSYTPMQNCDFDSTTGSSGLVLKDGEVITLHSDSCYSERILSGGRWYNYVINGTYALAGETTEKDFLGRLYTSTEKVTFRERVIDLIKAEYVLVLAFLVLAFLILRYLLLSKED